MLMEEYQVSRVTIRQAMTALSQAGYIMSRRGIGTEVTYEKIDEHMKSVISFTDEMKQHNITMNTSYCKMEKITPSTRVAMALEIPKTDFCYRLTRVRNVQGSPLVYTITYLKCVVELPLDEKYYMKSLYKFLKDTYQIVIEKGKDTLEAALPECMDAVLKRKRLELVEFSCVEGTVRLFTERILYVESRKHKAVFCCQGTEPETCQAYLKLDEVERRLKEYGFLRIHKSYLVNMRHVRRIRNYEAELDNGERLPIPRPRFQAVKEEYAVYKGAMPWGL